MANLFATALDELFGGFQYLPIAFALVPAVLALVVTGTRRAVFRALVNTAVLTLAGAIVVPVAIFAVISGRPNVDRARTWYAWFWVGAAAGTVIAMCLALISALVTVTARAPKPAAPGAPKRLARPPAVWIVRAVVVLFLALLLFALLR